VSWRVAPISSAAKSKHLKRRFIGVRFGIGVASGTDALELALRAGGIHPGDVVLTVAHTAVATVVAIERCGAIPAIIDIDPQTYTMDTNQLESALRDHLDHARWKTPGPVKAIVPVHLYGHSADMQAVMVLARRYHLTVIEDCAQAHGASLHGRPVGTWGHAAAFSFYPTKNLGAIGDGGMVVTDDPSIAERLIGLRQYGWRQRYISDEVGLNSRLDEMQAAILRVKLNYLAAENRQRQEVAAVYTHVLQGSSLVLPVCRPEATHVYHQYVVRTPQRTSLRQRLTEAGAATAIHYPVPVHLQPAYRDRLVCFRTLTHTEEAVQQVLSLPMYPELEIGQAEQIAALIADS
jgi:dTDP-4-amino-4,6-dideoxygalactose transaminase